MELLKDDESAYVRKDLTPFGFSKPTNIILENFIHTSSVIMGQELEFSFDIKTTKPLGKLRIEFIMGFLRKNDKHNQKVFKIAEGSYVKKIKKFLRLTRSSL